MVQTNSRERLQEHVCFPVTFPGSLVREMILDDLPDGWDALPYTGASQTIGDEWLENEASAVLKIPSVVNRMEFNYLLNPSHSDFKRVVVGEPIGFPVDPRMIQ